MGGARQRAQAPQRVPYGAHGVQLQVVVGAVACAVQRRLCAHRRTGLEPEPSTCEALMQALAPLLLVAPTPVACTLRAAPAHRERLVSDVPGGNHQTSFQGCSCSVTAAPRSTAPATAWTCAQGSSCPRHALEDAPSTALCRRRGCAARRCHVRVGASWTSYPQALSGAVLNPG